MARHSSYGLYLFIKYDMVRELGDDYLIEANEKKLYSSNSTPHLFNSNILPLKKQQDAKIDVLTRRP